MSDHMPERATASAGHPDRHPHRQNKKARKRRRTRLAAALSAIGLLVAGAVIADLNDWFRSSLSQAAAAAPEIEVDYVTYTTPQYAPDPLVIDIELRNLGKQLAILTALQFRVQQALKLPLCLGQGNLPATGHFKANLTPQTHAGTVVTVPVHQEVSAGGADRFLIDVQGPASQNETDYLYRTHLTLLYDRSRASVVNVGELLMAFPVAPNDQYFWTTSDAANHGARIAFMQPAVPEIKRCMITNSRKLRSFLGLPGVRPGLGSIGSQLSSSP